MPIPMNPATAVAVPISNAPIVEGVKEPALPFALRESTLEARDVETLRRIARDKNAKSGRYMRKAKSLPISD